MSATKILWGQISIVFLIILATTWGATQYVAWSLGYQAQLGPPWFELFGTPIYYPPAIFWWWYFYEAYAPPIFAKGGIIAASGGFIAIAFAIAFVWRARGRSASPPMARRDGLKPEVKAGLPIPMVSSSADMTTSICGMMAPSMCCVSRRPVRARASAWWCRRC